MSDRGTSEVIADPPERPAPSQHDGATGASQPLLTQAGEGTQPDAAASGIGAGKSRTRRQELHKWQMRIFALSWLTYAAFYFPRNAMSAAKVGVLEEGFMDKAQLGVLDSVYLAAYAAGQFIWGAVAERFGTRVVVTGGLIMAGVAALFMGILPAVWMFIPAMLAMGLAQSTGWSALSKNIASFFSVKVRGRAMGFFSTSYAFGGLVAAPVAGFFAYQVFHTWRAAFFVGAAVVLLTVVLFIIFQRNHPAEVGLPDIDDSDGDLDSPYQHRGRTRAPMPVVHVDGKKFSPALLFAAVKQDPMVLKLGIVYFLLKPARYAVLLWGPVLVMEAIPGTTALTAVFVPIAFGVAGIVAPIAIGWASDRLFGARRVPPTIIALGLLVVSLALWGPASATGSVVVVAALLALVGLTAYGADAMVSGVAAVDFGTSKYAAGATGFINGCGSIGAILGGLLPGFMSGTALFYGFAGAALVAALILLPSWNQRPANA